MEPWFGLDPAHFFGFFCCGFGSWSKRERGCLGFINGFPSLVPVTPWGLHSPLPPCASPPPQSPPFELLLGKFWLSKRPRKGGGCATGSRADPPSSSSPHHHGPPSPPLGRRPPPHSPPCRPSAPSHPLRRRIGTAAARRLPPFSCAPSPGGSECPRLCDDLLIALFSFFSIFLNDRIFIDVSFSPLFIHLFTFSFSFEDESSQKANPTTSEVISPPGFPAFQLPERADTTQVPPNPEGFFLGGGERLPQNLADSAV